MRKFVLVFFVVTGFAGTGWAENYSWQNISGHYGDMQSVAVNPDDSEIIFAGTRQGVVLRSEDAGKNWRPVLSIFGEKPFVNRITFRPGNSNAVYAATNDGLYYTSTQGKTWKRIFKGKNYFQRQCTAIAVLPRAILLGTRGGIFISDDNGRSWIKTGLELKNCPIVSIETGFNAPYPVYAACWEGVFQSGDGGKTWNKIFSTAAGVIERADEHLSGEDDDPEGSSLIRGITVDSAGFVYIAASRGIYRRHDTEKSWERITDQGLLRQDVRFITVMNRNKPVAVDRSNVFIYEGDSWRDVSNGLTVRKVEFLCADKQGCLYAAADKGVFKLDLRHLSVLSDSGTVVETCKKGKETLEYPSVSMIQKAAIKYAEVEPEKIIKWRKQAAKKAILPQVSVGINRNTTDLWHWEGGSTTKADDDILRRGRDSTDWDVTLSWNFGELIWNDDQTNIDVRSKLMVELRGQILDEVTKLYFERLRLKGEIEEMGFEEQKKKFEKELKLREVTAMLDGMTGGVFTRGK
ncbi:MAG: hypothetical protein WC335_01610 [Candidatus Omnitrophota bacterium]|jgi:photosystem II stability/assembly factor-like uncharacterized protein